MIVCVLTYELMSYKHSEYEYMCSYIGAYAIQTYRVRLYVKLHRSLCHTNIKEYDCMCTCRMTFCFPYYVLTKLNPIQVSIEGGGSPKE